VFQNNERKAGKLYYQPYSPEQKNILVVGPVAGNEYNEMVGPCPFSRPINK
jgi:apocytochrome f